jgi:hypothetical protein
MASDSAAPSALASLRGGTRLRPLSLLLALCSALAIALATGTGTAQAVRGGTPGPSGGGANPGADRRDNHCTTPTNVDLNAVFGISVPIVAAFCTSADPGEYWTPNAFWAMNTTFASTPPEFVRAGATPLEDFLAKFVSAKYVVDPGSRQTSTYVFPKSSRLWTGPFGPDLVGVATTPLGVLRPLSAGHDSVDVYWVFTGRHCDGLGADVDQHCLQAGENLVGQIEFDVTAPAPQRGR